jgi:hypothetical protein
VSHQANRGEPTDATTEDLVDSAHDQELLDHSDKNFQGRILLLPGLKSLDRWEPGVVFKGNIDFDTSALVGKLHNRHLGPCNAGGCARFCNTKFHDVSGQASQIIWGLSELTRSATCKTLGNGHQIHVRSGQVEARREGAEAVHFAVAGMFVATTPCPDGLLYPFDKLPTSCHFEWTRLDKLVEVADFFVKSKGTVSQGYEKIDTGRTYRRPISVVSE